MERARCLVDPGRYSVYHCNDLAAHWKVLAAREKELRDLMDRADQGGSGGAVIGSLAYRPTTSPCAAKRGCCSATAAEKNCNFDDPISERPDHPLIGGLLAEILNCSGHIAIATAIATPATARTTSAAALPAVALPPAKEAA